jgi:antagonist of KipI
VSNVVTRAIEVLDGGLMTTVQDLGRFGYQRFGVTVSGAMDGIALRAGNRLVGNVDSAAGLEITLLGPEVRFAQPGLLAVTGADLGASVDGRPIQMWRTIAVNAGSVLSFLGQRDGLRAYVALGGGVDVPVVLGSRSTSTRSGLGGLEGRPLRAGDRLPLGPAPDGPTAQSRAMRPSAIPRCGHRHLVRVVLGPQDEAFSDQGRATFLSADYTVSAQSDRIGSRLDGPRIAHRTSADIVSDGTTLGVVQVSGDGCPIVLMADRGTTGGYAKIATVISADLWRIAQAAPGDRIRFEAVDLDGARTLLREQESVLDALLTSGSGATALPSEDVYDEDAGSGLAAGAFGDWADALDQTRRRRDQ